MRNFIDFLSEGDAKKVRDIKKLYLGRFLFAFFSTMGATLFVLAYWLYLSFTSEPLNKLSDAQLINYTLEHKWMFIGLFIACFMILFGLFMLDRKSSLRKVGFETKSQIYNFQTELSQKFDSLNELKNRSLDGHILKYADETLIREKKVWKDEYLKVKEKITKIAKLLPSK